MQKKVTIYDVAKQLGISTATVNRAMNDKASVSEKTRKLVMETAQEMGYRPSKTAASLKRNPKRIAVLLPDTVYGYLAEVERGIRRASDDLADYSVYCEMFKVTAEETRPFIDKLYELAEQEFDGIIILPPSNESEVSGVVKELREKTDLIFATVTSDLEGSDRLFSIQNNGRMAGKMAAELLGMLADREKPVVMVTGQLTSQVHRNTMEGFREGSESFGLKFSGVYEHHDNLREAYDLAKVLVDQYPDLGGIYFGTANSVAFCKRLQELGYAGKISIVASDVFPDIAALMRERVIKATIFQNPFLQGRLAVRYLYEYMAEGRQFENDVIRLDPQIVLRSNLPLYSDILEQMKDDYIL